MKLKIIHILYRATVGGTERTVYNLISEQLRNDYKVICIILENGGDFLEKYESLLKENLFVLNINTLQGITGLYNLLKNIGQSCIIHNHARNLKLGFILKCVKDHKILTEHLLTDQLKKIKPKSYKKLKTFYNLYEQDYPYITSVSSAVKNALVNDFDINPNKIKVIFNGLEKCDSSVLNQNGSFIVGNATHFEKIKNLDLFISIAEQLISMEQTFKFILVGDGTQKSRIEEYIKAKKLDKNIILLEPQEDLAQFFGQVKLGLITSFSETFSLFAAECLARGIPVIAPAVGGLTEVVKNDNCGYLIESFNKEDFVEKILKLKNDQIIYKTFSDNARKYAKKFSIENIFNDYHKLYIEILN